jgi:ABC-type glutathione transport system ATPase component
MRRRRDAGRSDYAPAETGFTGTGFTGTGFTETGLADTSRPVIRLVSVTKTYGTGDATVHALRGVSLDVVTRDYVAIMGASGSGKSTLMNIIGCLDIPTGGRFFIDDIDSAVLDEASSHSCGTGSSASCSSRST